MRQYRDISMITHKGYQWTVYKQARLRVVLQREGAFLITTWENINKPPKQKPWRMQRLS